jgi:hypothetical protein
LRVSGGTLNRELSFKAEDRHFNLGIALLLLAMVMLGVFGVVLPIRQIAYTNPAFLLDYRGVAAPITVFGYMPTDTGHDGLFNLPKYRTNSERMLFAATFCHRARSYREVVLLLKNRVRMAKFVAGTCQALVTDRLSSERSSASQNSLKYILAKDMLRKLSRDPSLEP